ncbi:hypothetical protein [Paraburkholderia tropica]|uniref:hypothetical protein n=1 Tax=Paraburkholderia tropica TaxID=92647 RepID=UPI00158FB7C4|nr:hypothetical protein [Paraburkholderia tropica]
MQTQITYNGRPIFNIGYTDHEMTFTYEGEAIPSFTAPIERAREIFPDIFGQLSDKAIRQYEFSVELRTQHGTAI